MQLNINRLRSVSGNRVGNIYELAERLSGFSYGITEYTLTCLPEENKIILRPVRRGLSRFFGVRAATMTVELVFDGTHEGTRDIKIRYLIPGKLKLLAVLGIVFCLVMQAVVLLVNGIRELSVIQLLPVMFGVIYIALLSTIFRIECRMAFTELYDAYNVDRHVN